MNDIEEQTMLAGNDTSTPFVCGLCNKQFYKILPYFMHFKEHDRESDITSVFHLCEQDTSASSSRSFTCRNCKVEFPTLCSLHSHIMKCSRTGSYFYDHKRSIVFPVIIESESRQDEVQEVEKKCHKTRGKLATPKYTHVNEVEEERDKMKDDNIETDEAMEITPSDNSDQTNNRKVEDVAPSNGNKTKMTTLQRTGVRTRYLNNRTSKKARGKAATPQYTHVNKVEEERDKMEDDNIEIDVEETDKATKITPSDNSDQTNNRKVEDVAPSNGNKTKMTTLQRTGVRTRYLNNRTSKKARGKAAMPQYTHVDKVEEERDKMEDDNIEIDVEETDKATKITPSDNSDQTNNRKVEDVAPSNGNKTKMMTLQRTGVRTRYLNNRTSKKARGKAATPQYTHVDKVEEERDEMEDDNIEINVEEINETAEITPSDNSDQTNNRKVEDVAPSNGNKTEMTALQRTGVRTRYLNNRTRKTWGHLLQRRGKYKKRKLSTATKSESVRKLVKKPVNSHTSINDGEKKIPKVPKKRTRKAVDKETAIINSEDYYSTSTDGDKTRKRRKYTAPLFECEICFKKCMGQNRLKFHMISHSDERKYKCTECDASYKYSYHLKTHIKSHGVKPYTCDICGEGFVEAIRLKSHKIHKHTVDRNFICELCGLSFKFQGGLNRHLEIHNKPKVFVCEICGRQFLRKNNFKDHLWAHEKTPRYPCSKEGCSKNFSSNYQLQRHLKVHSGERPWNCSLCPRSFVVKGELQKHMKKVHCETKDGQKLATWSERSWKCAHCSSAFTHRKGLKAHMKNTHNLTLDGQILKEGGKVRSQCHVCQASFSLEGDLSKHLRRIHSQTLEGKHIEGCWDNRPNRCHICPSAFVQDKDLKKHIKDCHSPGQKSAYVQMNCPICATTFRSPSDLKKHVKHIHSQTLDGYQLEGFWDKRPYRCNLCPSAFVQTKDLRKHMKDSHDQELDVQTLESMKVEVAKTEKCPFCGETFIFSQECVKHIKRFHYGERKQWPCPYCPTEFKFKRNVKYHVRKAHGLDIDIHYEKETTDPKASTHQEILAVNPPTIVQTFAQEESSEATDSRLIPQAREDVIQDSTIVAAEITHDPKATPHQELFRQFLAETPPTVVEVVSNEEIVDTTNSLLISQVTQAIMQDPTTAGVAQGKTYRVLQLGRHEIQLEEITDQI